MNSNGFLAVVGVFVGCGSKLATGISAPGDSGRDEAQPAADATPDVSVAGFDDAPADAPAVVAPSSACNTGAPTSVSGKVYDPAGKNPVFNVTVYVPVGSLPPIGLGTAVCDPGAPRPTGLICNSTLGAVAGTAITTTDATGAFRIDGVPAGKNIPLVFQLGKWRREIVLPQIDPCTDYPVPAAMSRLPRNQGEGDIPQLAIVTGSCDRLACLLDKVGLDPVEFTSPGAGGRVHVYQGAGQAPGLSDGGAGSCSEDAGACPLWSTKQALERYDGVLLGCECGEHNETKPDKTPMHDWLDEGGRVLAVHYGSTWFRRCCRRSRALLRESRLLRRSRRRPATEFDARAVGLRCRGDEPRRRDTGIRFLLVVVYVRQRGAEQTLNAPSTQVPRMAPAAALSSTRRANATRASSMRGSSFGSPSSSILHCP